MEMEDKIMRLELIKAVEISLSDIPFVIRFINGDDNALTELKEFREWKEQRKIDKVLSIEKEQPKFIPADDDSKHSIEVGDTFNGSVEMVSIPDRPMMAAAICAGLLAGGCKDKGAALINKAVNYADMILDYTEEESNE